MLRKGYGMHHLLIKSLSIAVVLLVFLGCSEDYYYEHADTDYSTVKKHDLEGAYPLKDREYSGQLSALPLPLHLTKVTLTELDSSLNEGESVEAVFNFGYFEFPKRDYSSPYALITVNGEWMGEDSVSVDVTLQTLTDITEVRFPLIRLVNHLEVARVKKLVGEGYPFYAAKRKAAHELYQSFSYLMEPSDETSQPVEVSGPENKDLLLFALFTNSELMLLETSKIDEVQKDLADGEWDDKKVQVELADRLLEHWLDLYKNFNWKKGWEEYLTNRLWGYIESFLNDTYGLDVCSQAGQVFAIDNKESVFYGDSLVCDKGEILFKRLVTEREKEYGHCAFGEDSSRFYVGADSVYYICPAEAPMKKRNDLSFEYYYLYLDAYDDAWREALNQEIYDHFMGRCCRECDKKETIFRDSVFRCDYYTEDWKFFSTDSLTHYLDSCNAKRLWTAENLHGIGYVCTPQSWQVENEVLDKLMQERPCDSLTDRYRTVVYDSVAYGCSDIEVAWTNVYTFVAVDSATAADYDFLKDQEPCDLAKDSLRVLQMPSTDVYFRCLASDGKIDFVKIDRDAAIGVAKEAFVKSQAPCNPETDRFRTTGFNAFGETFYYICKNNKYSEYVLTNVSYGEWYNVQMEHVISIIEDAKKNGD